jgi:hypothetical protein
VGRFLNEGDNFKLRYKYSSHLIEYVSARSRLKNANIKFICDDIVNINKYNLSRNTFDNITLSNVGDFIDNQVYFNLVVNELMPLLTERGKMMVAYLIQISSANINKLKAIDFSNSKMIENGYLLIKKQLELIEMFNKLNPKWSDFATGDGRNLNHYKDSVLVLRK